MEIYQSVKVYNFMSFVGDVNCCLVQLVYCFAVGNAINTLRKAV